MFLARRLVLAHFWVAFIAFAVAALSALGSRVPAGLRIFLLALAIADDLGAVAVIAIFYTAEIHLSALDWAAATPGEHAITSRAIDTEGNVQPAPDDPVIANKHTYWESNGQVTRRVRI